MHLPHAPVRIFRIFVAAILNYTYNAQYYAATIIPAVQHSLSMVCLELELDVKKRCAGGSYRD